jgi:phage baseplate assembly protein gpV
MSSQLRSVRPRLLALAIVPLALLASCGGDDEPEETPTTTTTTTEAPAGGGTDDVAEAWRRNATELRDRVGEQVDLECPAGGRLGAVWGSNVYTDDSSICSAAVHAGLITVEEGGEVTIEVLEGQDEYVGMASNGVESEDFGPYAGSFSFPDADPLEVAAAIDWSRAANFYRDREEQEHTVICEPGGSAGGVWGTEVYTEDSSICTAAVHAGLITVEDGGEVTFELVDGQDAYEGSESNGITSNDFGAYGGSFRFVD